MPNSRFPMVGVLWHCQALRWIRARFGCCWIVEPLHPCRLGLLCFRPARNVLTYCSGMRGRRDLTAALRAATTAGKVDAVQKLLDAGAQAPPDILRAAALSPQPIPAVTIGTLLARGADPSRKTSFGLTTVDFAKRQGNDALVKLLAEAGIRDESPALVVPTPKPAGSVRAAVERAIAPLQRSDVAFLDRAGCVSCHNNSLTAMMVSEARARGFRVNEEIASSQLKRIAAFMQANSERALENEGVPGGIDTVSYILLGMAAEKYPSDTDHGRLGAIRQEQSICRWSVQVPHDAPAARSERLSGHRGVYPVVTRLCAV